MKEERLLIGRRIALAAAAVGILAMASGASVAEAAPAAPAKAAPANASVVQATPNVFQSLCASARSNGAEGSTCMKNNGTNGQDVTLSSTGTGWELQPDANFQNDIQIFSSFAGQGHCADDGGAGHVLQGVICNNTARNNAFIEHYNSNGNYYYFSPLTDSTTYLCALANGTVGNGTPGPNGSITLCEQWFLG